ncbi:hypothetical protein L210DRAFT_166934 [Boletus edulis BED1]|uniref:DUF6534 domain-containing protein n=1 Tax=Boletus edulis BED1 TaxID=1328754 RepID=A0AAD4BAK6_BOLED|nr:hypothetical protein L210DRAFT_166934 [Boletus edulis BED1]
MESSNPFIPFYGPAYGPLYLATLMSTGLYSVTCVQTFFYYIHYTSDSLRMKIFVAVLWALDTVHEALTVAGVYKWIIAGLIKPSAILYPNPELPLQLLSEAFFVHRIYVFSGKNIIVPFLWAIQAVCQIVVAILYSAKAIYSVDGKLNVMGELALNDKFFMALSYTALSLAAAVDILIAISMTFLLLRTRSKAGIANTAHILQRLTLFAVNTGIWTATFSILTVIFLHLFPPAVLYYALFGIPLGSLYCNTLLANLNARAYILSGSMTPVFHGTMAEKRSEMIFSPADQNTA